MRRVSFAKARAMKNVLIHVSISCALLSCGVESPPGASDAELTTATGQLEQCAPFNEPTEDIFIDPDAQQFRTWRNCYTIPRDDAVSRLQQGEFPRAHFKRVDGSSIFVAHDDLGGGELELKKCVFSKADNCRLDDCTLTVQSGDFNPEPVTVLNEYLRAVDRRWRAEGHPVIDCQLGVIHSVRNSWKQSLTRRDMKILRFAGRRSEPLIFATIASLSAGGSLHPLQSWSAGVSLDLMHPRLFPEVCDASVEQVTAEYGPNFGAWCPWGLQLVSVSCPGRSAATDLTALAEQPLDLDAPDVRAFCQSL
jgi:hypothetical protein